MKNVLTHIQKEMTLIKKLNKKINLLATICVAVFLLCCANLRAQRPMTMEFGAHVGVSYYIGDINPVKHFVGSQLKYGAMIRLNQNPRIAYRIEYTHGRLKASDEKIKWRPERKLGFMTNIDDITALFEFNFLEYYPEHSRRRFSPFIFGGVSVFIFDPKTYDGSVNLRQLHTEGSGYGRVGVSLPFGLGLKFAFTKNFLATVEWRMHYAFTDYLDDVSTVYPQYHAYYEGNDYTDPTGTYQEGQQRGNSSFKDWYSFAGITLAWKINLPTRSACNLNQRR